MICRNCQTESTDDYQYCNDCLLDMLKWLKEESYRLAQEEKSFREVMDFFPTANNRHEYPEDDLNNFEYLQKLYEGE